MDERRRGIAVSATATSRDETGSDARARAGAAIDVGGASRRAAALVSLAGALLGGEGGQGAGSKAEVCGGAGVGAEGVGGLEASQGSVSSR